ncbi:COP23 domain-containing protein [Nostoc sp. FACHB-190]|uniref:COP23 domain-containing protein n=1 Tax=Nostoc sp. FACHB-190 TaxID=2692838 RepID=UPI001686385A|nr:COP23 domain-containing protein [Nostoc sp. FACHB-190]MBD2302450.1 hypothetical protein [Nostoc sp. FACHB-190]
MQKQALFIGVALTLVTSLTSFVVSQSPSFSQSNSAKSQTGKVTFFCQPMFDAASGQRIPATVAWVPERKGHVRFIGWKSEYFNRSGWTPEKRCQEVTKKFQEFYAQGRLNYLSYGKRNGSHVICAFANSGETCNGTNQLFTVRSGSDPRQVIQRLMDIAEGKSAEPIFQNSGDQLYISVTEVLNNSPLLKNQ